MKGILDRFEGEQAVILVEGDKQEFTVNKTHLPLGSKPNTIFNIKKENDTYQITEINKEATTKTKQKSSSLMNQLRAKSKGSKFKK